MGGIWNLTSTPTRAGAYVRTVTVKAAAVPAGNSGIVAIPITADWGPTKTFVYLDSDTEFKSVFGPSAAHKSYLVQEAFRGGAKRVLAYRADDGTAAAATTVFKGTAGDSAVDVVTLTAKYKGTRGNNFKVVIRPNPNDITNYKDVLIYEGAEIREEYTYPKLQHAVLVSMINERSALVTAAITTGSSLELANISTATAFTGQTGDDGELTTSVYTGPGGVLEAFERFGGFDTFVLPAESDPSLLASLTQWTKNQNLVGNYVLTVMGGALNESISTANTRSTTQNCEYVVNLGRTDLKITYSGNPTPITRSTAELAVRLAGKIAAAGTQKGITLQDMASDDSVLEVASPLSDADIKAATAAGTVVFSKRGARVVVEDGITTFTAFTDEKDRTFSNIKSVRTIQQIGRDFNEIIEGGYIGQSANTAVTRNSLLENLRDYLGNLEKQQVLLEGSSVELDDRFDNFGENIYILIGIQFARELKRVMITLEAPGLA